MRIVQKINNNKLIDFGIVVSKKLYNAIKELDYVELVSNEVVNYQDKQSYLLVFFEDEDFVKLKMWFENWKSINNEKTI